MRNHVISFENVVKQFDDEPVLKNVSFEIEEGKFYTLLGPSGCGKTTILRIIAGFNDVTSGDVYFDGKRINAVSYTHLDVYKRQTYGWLALSEAIIMTISAPIMYFINKSLKFETRI